MNRHKVTKASRETLLILLLPQDCVSSCLCVSIFEMASNLLHALFQYRTAETIVFGSHIRRIVAPA